MAAPHVAGIAAALLMENSGFTGQQIHDAVANTSTPGGISTPPPGTTNQLAYYKPATSSSGFANPGTQCLVFFDDPGVLLGQASIDDCISGPGMAGKILDGVIVTGHTDRVETDAQSMADSIQFAQIVASYIQSSFPGQTVLQYAEGETNPFISTGDGVSEQLNRRAEIQVFAK